MQSILVVDDEKSIRESLTGILQDEGFTPASVDSGEKAIEKISEDRPDLILLDIWMPGMDGLETLTTIRDIYPDQLVVMMSGHGTIETAVEALKRGAVDYLVKPLDIEGLRVRAALDSQHEVLQAVSLLQLQFFSRKRRHT